MTPQEIRKHMAQNAEPRDVRSDFLCSLSDEEWEAYLRYQPWPGVKTREDFLKLLFP